jgi:uncharacterized membrane protein
MTWTGVALAFPASKNRSLANGCSADGSIIVGNASNNSGQQSAVVWVSGTPTVLPSVTPTGTKDNATCCSADGTIIVGYSNSGTNKRHATYWTGGPTWVSPVAHDLGLLAGGLESFAFGCSSDASLIVGANTDGVTFSPVVWTSFGAAVALPGTANDYGALACNSAGTIIFGGGHNLTGIPVTPAVKWTGGPAWSITSLGDQVGAIGPSGADFCNSTGSVVVGQSSDSSGNHYASTWSGTTLTVLAGPAGGAASTLFGCDASGLNFVGVSAAGVAELWVSGTAQNLPGVSGFSAVTEATAISADASTIVGVGTLTSGGHLQAIKWTSSVTSNVATMADLFFANTQSFVDFTQTANRRKFIFVNGGAQNLQPDGSGPFAVSPPVFLSVEGSDVPSDFTTNHGRGGSFFQAGPALTDGATDPPPVTLSTQSTSTTVPFSGILGDYLTGNIYVFDPNTVTDNEQPRKWLRRWRALPSETTSAVSFSYLSIDMETGTDVPAGTNPQVVLRWSDDGGKTWAGNRIIPVGPTGQTTWVVKFNRLGSTQRFSGSTRMFELSSTDPFKAILLSAEVLTK